MFNVKWHLEFSFRAEVLFVAIVAFKGPQAFVNPVNVQRQAGLLGERHMANCALKRFQFLMNLFDVTL